MKREDQQICIEILAALTAAKEIQSKFKKDLEIGFNNLYITLENPVWINN